MSFQDKISTILKISKEEACSVQPIDDGWIINAVPIRKDELEDIFVMIFNEVDSEKKRINSLNILKKIGSESLEFLPKLTNIVLSKRFDEKNFVQNYNDVVNKIIGNLDEYLKTVIDCRQVVDLGAFYDLISNYEYSNICWQKTIDLKPEFFFGWIKLSQSYINIGKPQEAINAIWQGITNYRYTIPIIKTKGRLDPKYKSDLENLISTLHKKDKKNYRLNYIDGLIFLRFYNNTQSAKESLIKCLRLNPNFVEAEYQLATCLAKEKNLNGQIETFKRILNFDNTESRALFSLASIYKELLDYDLAVHYLEILYQLEPSNPKWLSELANLYRRSSLKVGRRSMRPWDRNLEKSYFYYKKMLETKLTDKQQISDFYDLLIEMGKYEEAKILLMDFMSKHGSEKGLLRKLEAVHSWLGLVFKRDYVLKEINYLRNKESAYPKLLDILSTVRPNIPITLPRIAKFVNFPEDRMIEMLQKLVEENPDLGEYLELEQVFIRKEDTDMMISSLKMKYSTCFYCGMPIESSADNNCSTCDRKILKCSVCKLPISFGEEIGQCSLCETKGHLTHLEEWVKTQGKCPTCLQELPVKGIMLMEESLKKKD